VKRQAARHRTHPSSTHAWLHLPAPAASTASASSRADASAVCREPVSQAVRLSIGAARSRGDLSRTIEILADLMESGHL